MRKVTVLVLASIFSFSVYAKSTKANEIKCEKEIALAAVDALKNSGTAQEAVTKASYSKEGVVKVADQSSKVDSWNVKLPFNDTCSSIISVDLKKGSCALDTAKVVNKDCLKK